MLANINDNLRDRVIISFHTVEQKLFKRTTALLNRIGVFLILLADERYERHKIKILTGKAFVGEVPKSGDVCIEGEDNYRPWRRFLRLGPDAKENLSPFENIVDLLSEEYKYPDRTSRPVTPVLTPSALVRYVEFTSLAYAPASTPAPIVMPPNTTALRIEGGPHGQFSVSGFMPAGVLASIWRANHLITIDCNVPCQEIDPLVVALARLSGHSISATFFCRDRHRWHQEVQNLLAARSMPGPNVQPIYRFEAERTLQPLEGAELISPYALAERIHTELDQGICDELNSALYDCIGSANPVDTGWPIEANLRTLLWTKWIAWRQIIQACPTTRRRFLLLLASECDLQTTESRAAIRVGQKTLKPFLLKATLFALAFSVGSGLEMAPYKRHPGNIAFNGFSGHACGVAWLEGRELTSANVERNWTTSVVLLAELKSAFQLLQADPRLDQDSGSNLMSSTAISERPMILGADDIFRAALETGAAALVNYLTEIFKWRATISDNSLERQPL